MMKLTNGNKGFTLIEILIVVIVLGILIGIALPSISGIRKTAADNVDKANLDTLNNLTEAYKLLKGSYPTGSDAVDAQNQLISESLLKAVVSPPGAVTYTYSSGTWDKSGSN